MAVGKTYVKFHRSAFNKELIWLTTDVWKVALYTSSLVPAQSADQYWNLTPYTTNEVTGTGYTAGGQTLTSPTQTDSSLKTVLSCANPSWTTSTFTTAFAVIYDSTPATSKPLLGYIDFGGNQTVTAGTFTITIDATNGCAYWTIS